MVSARSTLFRPQLSQLNIFGSLLRLCRNGTVVGFHSERSAAFFWRGAFAEWVNFDLQPLRPYEVGEFAKRHPRQFCGGLTKSTLNFRRDCQVRWHQFLVSKMLQQRQGAPVDQRAPRGCEGL